MKMWREVASFSKPLKEFASIHHALVFYDWESLRTHRNERFSIDVLVVSMLGVDCFEFYKQPELRC